MIQSRNGENFIIVWLDSNMKESKEKTQHGINQFGQVINSIRTFTDSDQCMNFIRDIKDEKIFLIISDGLSQSFVQLVEKTIQLISIYIYSNHKLKQKQWIINHRKIKELEHDDKEKSELVEFCREQYADNENELKIINEFNQNYSKPSPIWWYTRECFAYSMLNKALRTQDVENNY
ncbi:unnamed protein product [Rotaria magnacalcarata]|uniref:Uncharacterized protein n=1 Tax=Rotaria magnacalcarata TaxID=392030 RepID=A0A815U185_9BILA|nr:unnamed protein product [Rotaria magnacalcarata]CAF4871455.1 unnamed protein product [Rotaria magnacalcarata]